MAKPELETQDRVLSTLNVDGSRRWIRPRPSPGRFLRRRRWVGYSLIALFVVLPYLEIGGKPAILLDVAQREFTFFGKTFLATDTVLLMLFLLSVLLGIFLLTAIFGRVWCGWACPQTVYMELVFRPLERLLEGGRNRQLKLDREGSDWRRAIKYPVFLLLSMFVAHVFLAYFVGIEALSQWVRSSPAEHPTAFFLMAGVTAAMFFDFAYFREQTCIVVCPYGRFQSALLDRQSIIIGYDSARGEPRGRHAPREERGDCVDCKLCVITCPTGIDIRDGLQMECIGCTQCLDACDAVMAKTGRPPGLIRYSSQAELAGFGRKFLRPRVVLYPALFAVVVATLFVTAGVKGGVDVTVLRATGSPFSILPDGDVSNSIRIKIANRTDREELYQIELVDFPEARLVSAEIPTSIAAGARKSVSAFVIAPPKAFRDGRRRDFRLAITDAEGNRVERSFPMLGPVHHLASPPQEEDR